MRTIVFFFVLVMMTACQTEQATDIASLEATVQSNPTPEVQKQLAAAYMEYIEANPTDSTKIGQYLFKAAKLHQQLGDGKKATDLLPRATEMLAATLYDPKSFRPNASVANDFVGACETFASINPQNAEAPAYLFRAAETARSTQNYTKALALYDQIYQQYPNYEKAPQSLFLKGFTLDNDMKRHDEAKAVYESFLEKHPDNEFADDTEFLIGNLGKSDDEIIKSFETKE